MTTRLLLLPETGVGAGTGHLKRCMRLCKRLGSTTRLYLSPEARDAIVWTVENELGRHWIERDPESIQTYPVVVIDRPVVSRTTVKTLLSHSLVVGIDTGGSGRGYCSYTIDIIPRLRDRDRANIRNLGFLDLPAGSRSTAVTSYNRALVTFGGEDPGNLTVRLVETLVEKSHFPRQSITVVRGVLSRWNAPAEVRVLDRPSNLMESLGEYDVVFTSFGLTAFEAAASGAAVILLNPSRYHARLGKKVGFADIGIGKPDARLLRRVLADPNTGVRSRNVLRNAERADLSATLERVSRTPPPKCPVCGAHGFPPIYRDTERTFYRCGGCGLIHRDRFADTGISYDETYFLQEYQRQYGKTYLQDFAHIRSMGDVRAKRIRRLLRKDATDKKIAPRILDIGCAYGPFLVAAREGGFTVIGLDVATAAVEYVRSELRIPAVNGSIEDDSVRARWKAGDLDAVSLWYVIEHLEDLRSVLKWTSEVLSPGGVFAFSTPNGSGISARKSRDTFLEQSPKDHVTVWNPVVARRILRRFGFKKIRVVTTGHHPQRFPWCGSVREGTVVYRILLGASRLFGLGDTFEVYARKG